MTHPRDAAAAAGTAAGGNVAASGEYAPIIPHQSDIEEARRILSEQAEIHGWPDGSWERFIDSLARRLAVPE